MPKKVAVGVVTSDKMQKTRRVEIPRLIKHSVYGKYIRQRTICHVHDEDEASSIGDTVEIIEAQSRSKMKRWNLVRVVNKNSEVDLAALRTSQEMVDADEQGAREPTVDETTETTVTATATDSEDEAPQPGESAETEEAADVNETEENNPAETEAEE
jgi:small subunit ribosomal protein S17